MCTHVQKVDATPTSISEGQDEGRQHGQTTGHYSAIKRNRILILATKQMNVRIIMLGEISQIQEATYCMIPFTGNAQKKIHR